MEAFNVLGEGTERVLGAASMTVQDLGEGSPLPELRQIGEADPDAIPLVRGFRDGIAGLVGVANGLSNPLSWARLATAPPKTWDEVRDRWDENYQTARIAYSVGAEPALREEFVRRFEAGENPDLLAMELSNPIAEMVGQIVLDPLNLLQFGASKLFRASRVSNVTQEFATVSPKIESLLSYGDDLTDAAAINKLNDLNLAIGDEFANVAQGLDDASKSRHLFALTTDGKRFDISRRVGTVLGWVGVNSPDSEKAVDVFEAMVKMASPNADERAVGLATALQFDAPTGLLSRGGMEAGIVLRKMAEGADGVVDFSKYADDLAKARANGVDGMMEFFETKYAKAIDELFPTVLEAAERGDDISPASRFLAAFDKKVKTDYYQPVNQFFADVYMGSNPGFAFRNLWTNTVHVFVDEGFGAFRHGTLTNAAAWKDDTMRWLGRLPRGMVESFGPAIAGSADVKQTGKWWQWALRKSEEFESKGAMRVAGHAVRETMQSMLQPGKLFDQGQLSALLDAGATDRQVSMLMDLIVEHRGHVDDAVGAWRDMNSTGNIETWKVLGNYLDKEQIRALDAHGYLDEVQRLVRLDTQEEALSGIDNIREDWLQEARKVDAEGAPWTDFDDNRDVRSATASAAMDGHMSDEAAASLELSVQANSNAFWQYNQALSQLAGEAVGSANKNQDVLSAISGLQDEFRDVVQQKSILASMRRESQEFVDSTWEWTRKIRAMKEADWAKVWTQIGISDSPPPGVGRRELLDSLWELHYRSKQRIFWANGRDTVAQRSEMFIKRLSEISPIDPNGQVMERARQAWMHAKQFDSIIVDANNHARHVSSMLRAAMDRDDLESAIRILAHRYDIASVSQKGAAYDSHILAVLRKHGGAGDDVSLLSQVSLEQSLEAFEARRASRGLPPVFKSLDDALGREVLEQTDEAAEFAYRSIDDRPVPPPANPNVMPSTARMAEETAVGFHNLLEEVKGRISKEWGKLEPAALSDDIESALAPFAKQTRGRVAEARLVAEGVGNAARKFTLHDYPRRRNIDLLLAYIYPYQFWYSRTYKNWMQRLVQKPGVVAAYAKYKEALAEVHAGAPAWWKYNVNTNELFGLNSENPLFFNLEATLNPLNGLMGVDFNDPEKRVGWLSSTLDDLGKFGPSTWTPFSIAMAIGLKAKGEDDAAARWGGRLFPQTAVIKAASTYANLDLPFVKNNELDPFVNYFGGGLDPYERRRVGRALGTLVEQGALSAEQANEAAHSQEGPYWDMAVELAIDKRAPSQLTSFMLGVGFKGRDPSDMTIDQMYQDYYRLWGLRDGLSATEFRMAMDQMRVDYPFMDAVLMSRRAGPERDIALAYNVLSRIPPGQAGDITQLVGIDQDQISKFYDDKGDLSEWSVTERDRFMAGVVDLSALLKLPSDATRFEWRQARDAYGQLIEQGEAIFGDDIWDRVDRFYAAREAGAADQDVSKLVLEADPMVSQALDWKTQAIFQTPILSQYYGGIENVERYYSSLKFDAIEKEFGTEIWDTSGEYWALRDAGQTDQAKEYLRDHHELKAYWDLSGEWNDAIEEKLEAVGEFLVEPLGLEFRDDQASLNLFQERVVEQVDPQPAISWNQWQLVMNDPLQRTLIAHFEGEPLSDAAEYQVNLFAEQLGMSLPDLLAQIQQAYLISIN